MAKPPPKKPAEIVDLDAARRSKNPSRRQPPRKPKHRRDPAHPAARKPAGDAGPHLWGIAGKLDGAADLVLAAVAEAGRHATPADRIAAKKIAEEIEKLSNLILTAALTDVA